MAKDPPTKPLTQPKSSAPAMTTDEKPRVRVAADGSLFAADSFQNFLTRTGTNTANLGTFGTYGLNPISRNRQRIEWAYRGSWVVGTIVDCVAEDMTREGVELQSDAKPEDIQTLEDGLEELQLWSSLCDGIKWGRLYGGALGLIMIDGQDVSTELKVESVSKGQFKGVYAIDRWALFPTLNDLVTDFGPAMAMPRFYDMHPDYGTGLPAMKIHHSRVIRFGGVRLPYWQRIAENLWDQSVVERLWNRLIAFDSCTDGAAQLVYKCHLRTYKVKDLRKIIALGGKALDGLLQQISMIRQFQANEGLTLMDAEDEFEIHPYTFTGLDLILLQFGQQLAGASQIPLVRLFGQSPAGLNATGESDLRTYYDGIKRQQNATLGPGVRKVYNIAWRSQFGKDLPAGWKLEFRPLWQMNDEQRAGVANTTTAAILAPFEKGVTARSTTLKELKQSSRTTGMFTNVTDEMIDEAVKEDNEKPPSPEELGLGPNPSEPGRNEPGKPGEKATPPDGKSRAQLRAAT